MVRKSLDTLPIGLEAIPRLKGSRFAGRRM
jgi:hypothetical protein